MFDFDVRSGNVPSSLGAGGDIARMRALRDAFAEPITRVPRRPPLVVSPSLPLRTALRAMAERRAAAALVAGHEILLGIVHGRDLVPRALEGRPSDRDIPVAEVMSSDCPSLLESDTIAYAVTKLWTLSGRPMPIVCPNGTIRGLLETEDVAAWLCEAVGARGTFSRPKRS